MARTVTAFTGGMRLSDQLSVSAIGACIRAQRCISSGGRPRPPVTKSRPTSSDSCRTESTTGFRIASKATMLRLRREARHQPRTNST